MTDRAVLVIMSGTALSFYGGIMGTQQHYNTALQYITLINTLRIIQAIPPAKRWKQQPHTEARLALHVRETGDALDRMRARGRGQ